MRTLARLLLILIAACGNVSPAIAQDKRGIALTIGLNSVDPNHYGGWSGRLQACEFDAQDMAQIAASRGFTVTTLLTKEATRKRVLGVIEEAVASLKSGETFMIAYSGHGGQVPDQNGDEADNEDETWCLFDGQVIDDELAALLAKFAKGVRVLVFSDSCHSGTITKQREYAHYYQGIPGPDFRALATRFKVLLSPDVDVDHLAKPMTSPIRSMPVEVAALSYRKHREFYDTLGRTTRNQKDSEKNTLATVLLISACQDNQQAADGTFNGLFTGTLKLVWHSGRFSGTYREFHRAILRRMPAIQSPNYYVTGVQDPTFEAETPFTTKVKR